MSEAKVNLVASTLTNSLGTTVIGHVGQADAQIKIMYPNGAVDIVQADVKGDFIAKAPDDVLEGEIVVSAGVSTDPAKQESRRLTIDIPAPVVTAVISTQNAQRLLEGRVNQPEVDVTVRLNENDAPIDLLVDKNHEFELVLPQETMPHQIEVLAKSRLTGKTGTTKVSLGVTTKTMVMPALTDEMIADYVAHNQPAEASVTEPSVASVAEPEVQPGATAKPSGLRGFFSKLFGK